ncbi:MULTISPECIES: M15 family metallopeptidase [Nocardiopsis]|uniref:Peptidase M15 n=1 Tax=Nocardiopsis sinuspersici TaxID=501010 RepID=A0A1V3C0B2_9ACTN|nr:MULTISPECIES: M15 family metallopeptidase [Nocardiopsis]OOC54244.1 peptidase M15 [Nocardiopsis sinuspersici]
MSEVTKRKTVRRLPAARPDGRPGGSAGHRRWPRRRLVAALCTTVAVVLTAWSVIVSVPDTVTDGVLAQEEPTVSAEDGDLPDDLSVTPFDTGYPAIAKLDGALLAAVQEAARNALEEGIVLHVTSGWRSEEYQRHLFDEAVVRYGSREEAGRFVETSGESAHVTGEAIDIGPTDAADWVVRRGSAYGLCQVYANEMWHFELLTEPGGDCPDLLSDAASR